MTTRMLINATARNELRIAIVEDGELLELDIEASETSTIKGNIYKGVVHNVEGSLEAAFVDFGAHKQGFLPFSEVSPTQYFKKPSGDRPRIQDVMKRGQDIIVQVSKDAVGDKGATLTTYLSLPGRYTVLMPGSDAQGVSRKIEDEKLRRRLKSMVSRVKKPAACGFIVRTAGLNQTRIGIQKDLDALYFHYQKVMKAGQIARAPSIIHAEPDLIARTLRDFFNDEIDEVWIDDREEYEAAVDYFQKVMPDDVERLHLFQNAIPIFAYYHVEEQIEATFERRVPLTSGGSIVIDETEALVAVDVNSGKMTSERDHEETVFKTNCEAAEELARQMKLRDLGGIVVADFIDMEETKHKRAVEQVLADAAKEDKARWKISRINSKGLCVFTRQRIRQGMRKAFQQRCAVCDGTGWVRTAESHSLSLLRRVETRLAQGGVGEARVTTHRETAEYLLNHKRNELLALERQFNCAIVVIARPDIDRGKDEVVFLSMGEVLAEITDKLPPREERRRERDRRKKKRKKKQDRERAAASAVNGEAVQTELFDGDDANGKKKRRRKRKKGPDGQAAAAKHDDTEQQLEEKGTTFTGRPSPELLERLKAARKARLAARGNKGPTNVAVSISADAADGFDADAEAMDGGAEAADRVSAPAPSDAEAFDPGAEAMDVDAAELLDRDPGPAPTDAMPQDVGSSAPSDAKDPDPTHSPALTDAADDDAPAIDAPNDRDTAPKKRTKRASSGRRRSGRQNTESTPKATSGGAKTASGSQASKAGSAGQEASATYSRGGVPRRVEPALAHRPASEAPSDPDQKARNRFLSRLFGG